MAEHSRDVRQVAEGQRVSVRASRAVDVLEQECSSRCLEMEGLTGCGNLRTRNHTHQQREER